MSRLSDKRRRPPHWRVRSTVDGAPVVLYAGPRAAAVRPYLAEDMARPAPTLIITRNGHRIWPNAEQLALLD